MRVDWLRSPHKCRRYDRLSVVRLIREPIPEFGECLRKPNPVSAEAVRRKRRGRRAESGGSVWRLAQTEGAGCFTATGKRGDLTRTVAYL